MHTHVRSSALFFFPSDFPLYIHHHAPGHSQVKTAFQALDGTVPPLWKSLQGPRTEETQEELPESCPQYAGLRTLCPRVWRGNSTRCCVLLHVPKFTQLTFQHPWIYRLTITVQQTSNLGTGPEASGSGSLAQCLSGPATLGSPEPGE